MPNSRIVARHLGPLAAGLALMILLGCGKSSGPSDPSPGSGTTAGVAGTSGSPAALTDAKGSAQKFATEFLAALKKGQATPDTLTPEFKKIIAEPLFTADQEKGYSDVAAGQWLKNLEPLVTATEPRIDQIHGSNAWLVVRGGGGHLLLRLARSGNAWGVDWLAVGPKTVPDLDLSGNIDEAAARFVAAAFLDALFQKQIQPAEGLMTLAGKAQLARPFESDKLRGYNRTLLKTKLEEFVSGGADAYTLVASTREGAAMIVTAEIMTKGQKKPLAIKLSKGTRAGEWLVESAVWK